MVAHTCNPYTKNTKEGGRDTTSVRSSWATQQDPIPEKKFYIKTYKLYIMLEFLFFSSFFVLLYFAETGS